MPILLPLDYRPRYDSQLTEIVPPSADEILKAISALGEVQALPSQPQALQTAVALINQCFDPTDPILNLIDVMLRTKRFDYTATWQVLVRLEPLIENKASLARAATHLYLPSTSVATFEQAQGAMWFATYTGNVELAREAIQRGAEVNTPIYPRMTALLLACKRGHDDLACLLLDEGAKVKFIGGTHDHETALSEALFRPEKMPRSLPRLQALDNGFSKEVHARKRICHEYSILPEGGQSYLEGVSFFLDGYRPRYILDNYLKQSRPFYESLNKELLAGQGPIYDEIVAPLSEEVRTTLRENPEAREKLCSAINEMLSTLQDCLESEVAGLHANPELMTQKAIKRLNEGKPVACFGVTRVAEVWKTGATNSHAWGLVITKDPTASSEQYIVQRCNRGYKSDSSEGILTRKMSREEVHALIGSYYKAANWKEIFLNSGENILVETDVQMKQTSFQHTQQKKQSIGNCCYYSAQSFARALMQGLFIPIVGDNEALSKSIKAACTVHTRPQGLKSYLDNHYAPSSSSAPLYNPDRALLKGIVIKTKAKLATDHAQFRADVSASLENGLYPAPRVLSPFGLGIDDLPVMTDTANKVCDFLFGETNPQRWESITSLNLSNLELTALPPEIDRLTHLQTLNVSNNQLPKLHIPDMPRLHTLDANTNALTEFSIGKSPRLKNITLTHNQLPELKLHSLPGLEQLWASYNNLEKAELCDMPSLTNMSFSNNRLKQIELHELPELIDLSLSHNEIEALPHLELPKLGFLSIDHNQLKNVPDHSAMPILFRLNMSYNQMKTLSAPTLSTNALELSGNPILFSFNEDIQEFSPANLKDLPDTIHFFKAQQLYAIDPSMTGSIAALYHHLIAIAPEFDPAFFETSVDDEAKALFGLLSEEDKELIEECIPLLSETTDFDKEKRFDSKLLFYGAVHNAILYKYEALSRDNKMRVNQYGIQIEKENYPERDYEVWGRGPQTFHLRRSKINLLRLAIALRIHGFSASTSSSSSTSEATV